MTTDRHPLSIALPAAGSLAISALLLAALLSVGLGQHHRADGPLLVVSSFALLKGVEDGAEDAKAAEKHPPLPAAAPPAQAVQEKPLQPTEAPPLPPPILVTPWASALPPASAAASAKPQPATAAAGPSASTAASAAPAPAARRGAADGLDVVAPAGTSRSYAARIRSWLYAHKVYPKRARMRREEGIVEVRFTIDREGLLLSRQIVTGSGHATLDDEAFSMMERSSPYPKAPHEIAGERIEFTAPVAFVLPT